VAVSHKDSFEPDCIEHRGDPDVREPAVDTVAFRIDRVGLDSRGARLPRLLDHAVEKRCSDSSASVTRTDPEATDRPHRPLVDQRDRPRVHETGRLRADCDTAGWQQRWCTQLGLPDEQFRTLLAPPGRAGSLGQIDLEQYTATAQELLGLDDEQAVAFMDDIWDEYLGTPNTELIGHFTGLRDRVRTGILSNSFVGAREREQERYGFEDRCDAIAYSHEIGVMKPGPAAYTAVCALLEAEPHEVLFLDDLEMCVKGAEAVGMTAVLYRDNKQAIAEIEAHLAGAQSH
jgi:FMN phosphatase YigB (HAD superfamily)